MRERTIPGTLRPAASGRSLDYTDADRTAHYTGTVRPDRCPVCLMGMIVSHGRSDIAYAAPSADPAPWTDAVPFDRTPPVPDGWSIAADGVEPGTAIATADRFRSHGRSARVIRYMARTLSLAQYVTYRVIVDIPPTDAAWAAYRGE